MEKTHFFLPLVVAALLCGCDKQAKINSAKIDLLSQKIVQLEQGQSKQMAVVQTELTSLTPMLDKMNDFYFEKSHDEAFFFHTNTLYLLLTVGQQIEAQLRAADAGRVADSALAYSYHTNEMDLMSFHAGQIQDALAGQEKRIEDNYSAETERAVAELLKQIKLSAPDADEIARRKEMEADVAQIRRDLEQIKARLGITNQPAASPLIK